VSIVIPIITLVVGVVAGAWFNNYLKRPKLVLTGGGGGGGPGSGYRSHVSISNRPGLFGLGLSETVIFGKRLHGRFEKGLTIDRNPANECTAAIYDNQSGRYVAPLWWRLPTEPDRMYQVVTVPSGTTFDLMLFARLDAERSTYFIYVPTSETSAEPKVPPAQARLGDEREFFVQVTYSYGRQKLKFDCAVRKEFDGTLRWETKTASSSF
jgi:hypothetical protein